MHGVVVLPKNANLSECEFEYGPTTAYGQTAACEYGSGNSKPAYILTDASLKVGPGVEHPLPAGCGGGRRQEEAGRLRGR